MSLDTSWFDDASSDYTGDVSDGAYAGSSYDSTPQISSVLSTLDGVASTANKFTGVITAISGGLAGKAAQSPDIPTPVQPKGVSTISNWAQKLGVGVGVMVAIIVLGVVGVGIAIWKLI